MADPETLAALAGQIDELRGHVDACQAVVRAWQAKLELEGIGATLVLRLEVKQLADKLEAALSNNRLEAPAAPYWDGLAGDELRSQLAELREWVETFLRRNYPGYTARLAACWVNHPDAVWELSTLMAEWIRVYGDEDNRDLAAAQWWHERWLPGVLGRLATVIKCDELGCRATRPR